MVQVALGASRPRSAWCRPASWARRMGTDLLSGSATMIFSPVRSARRHMPFEERCRTASRATPTPGPGRPAGSAAIGPRTSACDPDLVDLVLHLADLVLLGRRSACSSPAAGTGRTGSRGTRRRPRPRTATRRRPGCVRGWSFAAPPNPPLNPPPEPRRSRSSVPGRAPAAAGRCTASLRTYSAGRPPLDVGPQLVGLREPAAEPAGRGLDVLLQVVVLLVRRSSPPAGRSSACRRSRS